MRKICANSVSLGFNDRATVKLKDIYLTTEHENLVSSHTENLEMKSHRSVIWHSASVADKI